MPLMTRLRESLSKVFAVFAGVFVVYIVLDWGMDITGRKSRGQGVTEQNVGTIDGQPISYHDFSELVKEATDNQQRQNPNNQEIDENQQRNIRDQIWSQLVDEKLFDKEAKRLGVTVTDQEILDWVNGDTPPDFLRQQFTDSTGNFNRAAYQSALHDPKNRPLLIKVEDFLRKQREREKLQSIVLASVRVSDADVMQRFLDQNIKYDGEFAFFDPNVLVPDDQIKVTDDDLHKYYNDHSAEYKTEPTRKLKYVSFTEAASKADSDAVISELNDILSRTKAGADFKDLAKTYSDTPPSDVALKHGEMTEEKEAAVFSAKPGDIIGPIKEGDG